MMHFGIICPPVPGHLNPILALGRELQTRGHPITLINFLDAEIAALKAGVEFQAIAATLIPVSKPLFAIAQALLQADRAYSFIPPSLFRLAASTS
jgi:UDP:flavonoid glycosyltransferase YjiC (YdhE family)